jgi:hypothetical protein
MLFRREWKGGEEEGLGHTVVGGGIAGATAGLLRLGRPRILQE